MAKFPTHEEMCKKVAEKALDEYIYKGKTLREWIDILGQQMIISEELLNRLNERKMSIPISETYTEDHKVGWKDGIFWSDVLEIFEELEGET